MENPNTAQDSVKTGRSALDTRACAGNIPVQMRNNTQPPADLLARTAAPYLAEITTAAQELALHGWAEANAGNLSLRLNDIPEFPGPENRLVRPFPDLGGIGFLITGAGTRMRELAKDPVSGLCLLRLNRNGTGYRFLCDLEPSSELPAHLATHAVLAQHRPEHRTLIHTHPTALVALTLLYPEPEALLGILGRMHSEMDVFQDRLTALPFLPPGSEQLAQATGQAFKDYSAVIWARHGIIATGPDFYSALDLIQVCDKAAQIALLSRNLPGSRVSRPQGKPMHKARSLKGWNAPDGIETFYKVRSRDSHLGPEQFAGLTRRPVHIVLDNLRSAFNVGSIFRLADAARVAELIPCGYTAYPPNNKLEQTSLGTTGSVPWRRFDETTEALRQLKSKGIQVVGVETAEQAVPYHRFEYRFPTALVLGNEALGLSQSVLELCDGIIDIPVFGYKNSINVAAAAAVILYDIASRTGWLDQTETAR